MKPRLVEPVGALAAAFYSLREIASRLRHARARAAVRRRAASLTISPTTAGPLVNYGRLDVPRAVPSGPLPIGGQIKLIPLKSRFPESPGDFNLIYLVSSALPAHAEEIVAAAKARGAKLVWNQNGIAYPGCYGSYYAWFNLRMVALRRQADYIFNQSEFSRLSAERYLGPSSAPWEICLNPVDTSLFVPAAEAPDPATWQILAAGTSHALYRTKSALDTLRVLLARGRPAHLTIAGEFRWKNAQAEVAKELHGLEPHVTVLPPFHQSEAPAIYQKVHVALHTKFNDPCPTVPIEAMACGIPVVGTASGGMPEIVAPGCGILTPVAASWTHDLAGEPSALADAVEGIMQNHPVMSRAARDHAVRTFDVNHWLARHDAVFRQVLAS
jgi:glycosyltransferase involved in cell wall biosynthesis